MWMGVGEEQMSFNIEKLGALSREKVVRADPEAIEKFARATNDDNPAALAGLIASPLFSTKPMYRPMGEAISSVTPPERMMYTLHGEQDMRFLAPVRAGVELHATARPVGIVAKSSGTTISVLGTVTDEHGVDLCEQRMSMFIRGGGDKQSAGEPLPPLDAFDADAMGRPAAARTQMVDDDQTFRFAAASGDPMKVHLDAEIARKFGLPGIICHGLFTMAMAGNAAIAELAEGDPQRMKRLAVRFAKPLLPGQEIFTRFWRDDESGRASCYRFETQAADGAIVLSNGVVEIASA